MTPTLERLIERVKAMSPEEQARVLGYAEGLQTVQTKSVIGLTSKELLNAASKVHIDVESLDEMEAIIQEAFGRIDEDDIPSFD